jgi:acyl carrier protein
MEPDLEREITQIVAEIIEMDDSELWARRNDHFVEQLGVDSMLALEMLAILEKRYKIEIPEESLLDLTSLQATIDLVRRKVQETATS